MLKTFGKNIGTGINVHHVLRCKAMPEFADSIKKATNQLGMQYYTLTDWHKERKAGMRLSESAAEVEKHSRIRELERICTELLCHTEKEEVKSDAAILYDTGGYQNCNLQIYLSAIMLSGFIQAIRSDFRP